MRSRILTTVVAAILALTSSAFSQGIESKSISGAPDRLSVFAAGLALKADSLTESGTPPQPTSYLRPTIPGIAQETMKEGFVHVEVAVSDTGQVTDARVIESYPIGFFDDTVLSTARSYTFTPATKDGMPVVGTDDLGFTFFSDLYENDSNKSQRGGVVRGISQSNYRVFAETLEALQSGDLKATGKRLDQLTKRHDAGRMSVTDAARYFTILTHYARLSEHFIAAIVASNKALMLAKFVDNGAVIEAVHIDRMISYSGVGQNDNAVDYYDGWRASGGRPTREFAKQIESLREKGWGKGRPLTVVSYDETQKSNCRTC